MTRHHPSRILALTVLAAIPLLGHAADDSARFRVRGELKPAATSSDGRFTLRAEVRVTPAAESGDGRFVLKSTNASCNPLDFSIFADSFEGP